MDRSNTLFKHDGEKKYRMDVDENFINRSAKILRIFSFLVKPK